jgi:peptide/nickel transport system substrate-binding protein
MVRSRGGVTASVLVLVVAASCTSTPEARPTRTIEGAGGTLRVGLLGDGGISGWCPVLACGMTYDPQSTTFVDVFELNRCCFVRTLLSYNGGSVADGGTVVRPDLATTLPTVSSDGLTWTFHLRSGVHYAPPFADTEIVAVDFIRSLERAFSPASAAVPWAHGRAIGGYWMDQYLLDVVAGARAFADGNAEHVTGLEAPEPHTLVVHLTRPTGDLPNRMAIASLGPIPENPARPDDPFGVAQGHDFDYGDVIVSSGPYMFEGSEKLSFEPAPADQQPATGNGPDMATLVRNPSWSAANDTIRTPRPDRIEFYVVRSPDEAEALVRSSALDVVMNWPASLHVASRWREDPELRDRVVVAPADGTTFLLLNLAIAPFDDVHVRRAMNLVVDREAIAEAMNAGESEQAQDPFTHLALDSYEDNLLVSYSPPGVVPMGDVAAARDEMRLSGYDTDGDGRCDASVCSAIRLVVHASAQFSDAAHLAAKRSREIGLELEVDSLGDDEFFPLFDDPLPSHVPALMFGWYKDYPNASTFFPVLLDGDNIGRSNWSMTGASDALLRRNGYTVEGVPSVDDRIEACEALLYGAQTRCWAELDQYLTEQIVPWVPLTQSLHGWLFSSRVRDISIDASTGIPLPAIERLRIEGPSPASPPPIPPVSEAAPIPDGVYRTEVTIDDIVAAGGFDDQFEDVGTFTITLRDGWFVWHQRGDDPIFNPIAVGRYEGSNTDVTFRIDTPVFNAGELSDLTWRIEGDAIVFDLDRCTGAAAKEPPFCAFQTALFTAQPWERVSDVA